MASKKKLKHKIRSLKTKHTLAVSDLHIRIDKINYDYMFAETKMRLFRERLKEIVSALSEAGMEYKNGTVYPIPVIESIVDNSPAQTTETKANP